MPTSPHARRWSHDALALAGDLMLAGDLLCLLVAAWLGTRIAAFDLGVDNPAQGTAGYAARAVLIGLVLAPVLLRDQRTAAAVRQGRIGTIVRSHAVHFAMFACALLVLDKLSHALIGAPRGWLAVWCALGLLSTTLLRILVGLLVRRLRHMGALAEVVAIVGDGPSTERLLRALRTRHPDPAGPGKAAGWHVDVIGVFGDEPGVDGPPAPAGAPVPAGTLAQLIELGQCRRIDWIVIALPASRGERIREATQRLKALSVPIALCPECADLPVAIQDARRHGQGRDTGVAADRRLGRPDDLISAARECLPPWLMTVASLPWLAFDLVAARRAGRRGARAGARVPGHAR